MPSTERNEYWILGVILGLLGSIAINTGNNIQALGLKSIEENAKSNKVHSKRKIIFKFASKNVQRTVPVNGDEENPDEIITADDLKLHPYNSGIWIVGTIIFVTGSLLNFASYAFAAQSMLASLESIQFVTNLLFGKFMLKANVTKTMIIGTVLTVMGTLLAVQFSSKAAIDFDIKELQMLYSNPAYVTYLVLMAALLVLLHYLYRHYERRKINNSPLRNTEIVMPLVYSIWSALFGTQSVVQAKVLAELLAIQSCGDDNIFRSWFTYFTITYWLMTVGVWLTRLNKALSKFNPMFIIPLLQCSFIFFAILSGGIFFKEFNNFSTFQWLGFWIGICVMFSGLTLLTPKNKKVSEEVLSQEVAILLLAQSQANEKESSGMVSEDYSLSQIVNINGDNISSPVDIERSIINNNQRVKNDCSPAIRSSPTKDITFTAAQDQEGNKNEESMKENNDKIEDKNKSNGLPRKRATAQQRLSWIMKTPEDNSKNNDVYHQDLSQKSNTITIIPVSRKRSPRRSLTQSAVVTMKDVMLESAKGMVNCSNMLLTPHNGTGALTNAMVASTKQKEEIHIRMKNLKRLQFLLLQRSPSLKEEDVDMTDEILELVHELGLESNVLLKKSKTKNGTSSSSYSTSTPQTSSSPATNVRGLNALRSQLGSPRTFRKTMLQKTYDLEKNLEQHNEEGKTSKKSLIVDFNDEIT